MYWRLKCGGWGLVIIEQIIDLIAPHYCLGCGRVGDLLCDVCRSRQLIKMVSRCYRCGSSTQEFRTCKSCRSSTPLFQVWSASVYDGLSKAVVGKLKFGRGRAAAPTMALHMAQALPALPEWLVTHIPTANYRVRRRGYDQAQLIARHLSHLTARPYAALLARSGSSRQLGQTRAMRRKQMQHAFLPINTDRVEGRHILLIDDVLTTGATLEAAAFTLKKAGAKRVSAAVFAAA